MSSDGAGLFLLSFPAVVNKIFYWLILAGLLLLTITPLLVSTSLLFPFITGKGFFFRVVMEIIFALWLILALRDPAYRPKRSWLLVAMSAFLLVLALATAWGANPYRSFWSNYERMEGLVSYLHLFAYFLILISVMKTEKLWSWFLHSSLAVNAVIGVYSLLQLAGKLDIHQGSVRVDATFGNATYLAVYALFHIFLLALLIFRLLKSDQWRRAIYKWLGGVYLCLLALNGVILFYTQTRGAILGVIGGVMVGSIWLMVSSARGSRERRWSAIALGVTVALVAVFLLARQSNFVKQSQTLSRFASISLEERTTQARFLVWNMSWQGFKERPILGWGPENYIAVFNKHYDPRMYNQEQWFDRAHNVIFDWLIAGGLLGLLAYLALFAAALYYLFKRRRETDFSTVDQAVIVGFLAAYFFHNFFVFDQLISHLLFFGLLAYLHTRFERPWSARTGGWIMIPAPRWLTVVGSAVAVASLVLVFYFINLKPLLASRALIGALGWQRYPEESLKRFERVFAYNTFGSTEATEQLLSLSLSIAQRQDVPVEIKQKYLNLAAERLETEIKRAPLNARYPFFAGSFYLRAGQTDLAIARLETARRLSPKKQAILFELGSAYLAKSELSQALAIWKEAYDSAPDFDEARKIYALGAIYDNKLPLAAELLSAGAKDDPTFLLDERLVQAYGSINQPNALVALWQEAITANPKFEPAVMDFIADLRKKGIIN